MQFLSFLFLLLASPVSLIGFFAVGWTGEKGVSLLLSSSCSASLTLISFVSEWFVRSARLKRVFPLV